MASTQFETAAAASPRAIDHPQIAVTDLDAAAEAYRRLGFSLAPRMQHSFGTSNHLIMFKREYLELIGGFERITDPQLRAAMSPPGGHDGLLSLALFSNDIPADAADFAARGGRPETRTFSRPVLLPDGGEGVVSFSGCGVVNVAAPRMQVFACHQHNPELVWVPEWTRHENGALGVKSVLYVADAPSRHADYFELMVGRDCTREVGGMVEVKTGHGGRIEIVPPSELARRLPGAEARQHDDVRDHGVAVRVRVADLSRTAAVLRSGGVPFVQDPQTLTVPASEACGVVLEFAQ